MKIGDLFILLLLVFAVLAIIAHEVSRFSWYTIAFIVGFVVCLIVLMFLIAGEH